MTTLKRLHDKGPFCTKPCTVLERHAKSNQSILLYILNDSSNIFGKREDVGQSFVELVDINLSIALGK